MRQQNINKLAMNSVLALGAHALLALEKMAGVLPLKHITPASMSAKLENAKRTNSDYQAGVSNMKVVQQTVDAALKDAMTFAQVSRDFLKPKLGSKYSHAWNGVGFFNRSLRIPRSVPKALGLVGSMALFFEKHPDQIVPGVLTPEAASAAADKLSGAYTANGRAKADLRQLKVLRDQAFDELRHELILLRRELSMVISDNDPNWLLFGFKLPAAVPTPPAPDGLKVEPIAPNNAHLSWGHTIYAERFHIWEQIVGIDERPVRIATVTATSKFITDLPAGAQVRFSITAVNATGGESLASEAVEIVVMGGDGA